MSLMILRNFCGRWMELSGCLCLPAQPPLLLVVISPSRVTVILAPHSGSLEGLARVQRSLTPLKIHSGSRRLGLKGAHDDTTTAMECWGA